MTVNVAGRTRRRATPTPTGSMVAPGESMAIGEIDQTVFDCPSCTRPLALGAKRCPGCGTRLLGGVAWSRVSTFVAAGLAIGLVAGGGAGYALGMTQGAVSGGSPGASGAPVVVAPSAAPSTPPTATPSAASSSGTGEGITPLSRAAMIQAIGANDRLAVDRTALLAVLAEPTFDASAAARVFRSISADSVYARQLAEQVLTWPGAAALGTEMATFYGRVHDIAAEALVASVRNERAYRTAAAAMAMQLALLPAVDAAVRSAATAAGVDLPASSSAP